MTTVEALKAARALIEDPKRWTTGAFARSGAFSPVLPEADSACRWCALGALERIVSLNPPEQGKWPFGTLFRASAEVCRSSTLPQINDSEGSLEDGSTGHPAVLKIYDKAIELAEQEAEASK